jgi:hypothetical protein
MALIVIEGCLGSRSNVEILEKRNISCPCRNSKQRYPSSHTEMTEKARTLCTSVIICVLPGEGTGDTSSTGSEDICRLMENRYHT